MASLSDTLRKNSRKLVRGPGGVLSEEDTGETVQELAAKQGLSSPPITPLGAAITGANADQQKMAGSAAQKEAALNLAAPQPTESLQDVLRRKQSRTQMTAEEQAQEKKSSDLANLGNLGSRVTDLINKQRINLGQSGEAAAQTGGVQVQVSQGIRASDVPRAKQVLAELRKNPTDMNLMLEANKLLGYDVNRQLSPDEINKLYEDSTSAISRGAAGIVDDDLTMEDIIGTGQLGYTPDELSNLLDIPADQLGKMSVAQIRNRIDEIGQQEFSETEEVAQQTESSLLGQAERGMAQDLSREFSATGVRATEADFNNLQQAISKADVVLFAGKEIPVEQLLNDEYVSSAVAAYLQSAPDSEYRKTIDSQEPELSNFIRKHQAVLSQAADNLSTGAGKFAAIQERNKKLQTIGGIRLNDSLIDTFLPQTRQLQASDIDTENIPILAAARNLPPDLQQSLANNLNSEASIDPGFAREISGLDGTAILNWEIHGGPDSKFQQNYIAPKRFHEEVQKAGNDPEKLVQLATRFPSMSAAQDAVNTGHVLSVMGKDVPNKRNIVDINGDGQLDDPDIIRANLRLSAPKPSLRVPPGSNVVYQKMDIPKYQPLDQTEQKIFDVFNRSIDASGNLDYDAVMRNAGQLGFNEIEKLKQMNIDDSKFQSYGGKNILTQSLEAVHRRSASDQWLKQTEGMQPQQAIEHLTAVLNLPDNETRVDREYLQEKMGRLLPEAQKAQMARMAAEEEQRKKIAEMNKNTRGRQSEDRGNTSRFSSPESGSDRAERTKSVAVEKKNYSSRRGRE